ncbi:thymic stromal cotransporter homolog [Eublepharis macularius]|uniref:Thymic stromal cotransporter homolog n=1 Tax=Eublepharis macularius TaxID=481883 RepID=A0AA97L5Q2_EUBMA|nr:thymic stromal cotransporter homolog [Eublepharis macularius]
MMEVRTWIEPVVAAAQLASSFYDTGLLLVVKNYYNHTNSSSLSASEGAQQKAISNFYIIYNLLQGLTPLLSAYSLARLGDVKDRKISICVPLLGYLLSRTLLLLLILLPWPIEVMYGAAVLHGLSGGFTTYWASVMAVASLSSSESRRSLRLFAIELIYGIAGFLGSIASGHLFVSFHLGYQHGTVLVSSSIALYAFCLFYSLFVLKVPKPAGSGPAASADTDHSNSKLTDNEDDSVCQTTEHRRTLAPSKLIIIMLFVGGIMYDLSVAGAIDVLPLFLLKEPLRWGPEYIGYSYAAGYVIFITSFLGVFVFSRFLRDTTMIMIGIVSFAAGIFIMAFVQWTYLFYIARVVMLFSLIPMPTIRSVLSKHVEGSSYGKVFVLLQLSLVVTGVVTSTVYNKIYQSTLDWFGGFCFLLSFGVSCLSLIPISIVAYKQHTSSGSLEILTE